MKSDFVVHCLGASNTAIVKTPENERVDDVNYPVILGLLLRKTVRNFGVPGCDIARSENRSDSYVERSAQVGEGADLILVQGFGNDFRHKIPLGEVGSTDPYTYCGAIGYLIAYFRRNRPDSALWILSGLRSRDDSPARKAQQKAFFDVCRHFGIEPIDFESDPLIDPFDPESMPDGVHMSESACRHYADLLAGKIREAFPEKF